MGGIASHVTEKNSGIREKLPELAIGDEERAKSAQTFESVVAVLPCCVLINRGIGAVGAGGADVLSLPDEVLEEVALVLGEK